LYSFCAKTNCTDGAEPISLVQGTNGNFYGLTFIGGADNDGIVFKLTSAGVLTVLHNFCSSANCTDGANPKGGLIQATDGKLYSTTYNGGAHNSGTIFKITTDGTLTVLYNFCSVPKGSYCADGSSPAAGVFQSTNGDFYGTTYGGGTGYGSVYELSTGLDAFVQAIPGSGAVGTQVTILGTDLSGTTAVKFNGVKAAFSVVSATQITATVPSGATTGKIKVTTPSGTLVSSASFQIAE
jgi:uncharacterized repeat protein (TIGR03803 family)